MLKNTILLLWNQKLQYIGILTEQSLVFIVLLICIVNISDKVKKYNEPGRLDTKNTITFGFIFPPNSPEPEYREISQKMDIIIEHLKQQPSVISISKSVNFGPYLREYVYYYKDSLTIDNQKIIVHVKTSDINGITVFKPNIEEGEWFTTHGKLEDGNYPAIISRQLAEKAGWENSIGKIITYRGITYKVIGVISGIKQSTLAPSPAVFITTTITNNSYPEYTARIKNGTKNTFNSIYYQEFRKQFTDKNLEPMISDVDQAKLSNISNTLLILTFQAIPTVFLLIFAFIGTFGLFTLYSQKRKHEFALRLVSGSTSYKLTRLVILESLLITISASLPGVIIFYFAYELNSVNLIALGITLVTMLLFSTFSAWLPAYQVSRINPAETLHYE